MYSNDIEGYMRPIQLDWLYETAKQMCCIAEVGSWKGRSTKALLDGCKGTVYAIDTFLGSGASDNLAELAKQEDIYQTFMRNVGDCPNLKVVRADSLEAVKDVPMVEMVFIDATHTPEACREDLKAWLPKCKKLIAGHDYYKVKPAVDELVGEVTVIDNQLWYRYL